MSSRKRSRAFISNRIETKPKKSVWETAKKVLIVISILGGLAGVWQLFFPDLFKSKEKGTSTLECVSFYLDTFEGGKPIDMTFKTANFGASPAYVNKGIILMYLADTVFTQPPQMMYNSPAMVINRRITENNPVTLEKNFTVPLNIDEVSDYYSGQKSLYLSGQMFYKEESTKRDKIYTFCVKMLPGDKFITVYNDNKYE